MSIAGLSRKNGFLFAELLNTKLPHGSEQKENPVIALSRYTRAIYVSENCPLW